MFPQCVHYVILNPMKSSKQVEASEGEGGGGVLMGSMLIIVSFLGLLLHRPPRVCQCGLLDGTTMASEDEGLMNKFVARR